LRRYSGGTHAAAAKLLIEQIRQEEASRSALQKKAEAEALAKRQQEERIATEKRAAEERARQEAEAKRQAAAEAAKIPAEPQRIASLPQGPKGELPERPVNDPTTLARSLQAELKRLGCDPGAVDGNWSAKAKDALRDFNEAAKPTLLVELPTEDALQTLREKKGRVCALACGPNEKARDGRCVARTRSERTRPKVSDGPQGAPGKRAQAKQTCRYGRTGLVCSTNWRGSTLDP
jgi:hypothetical protein